MAFFLILDNLTLSVQGCFKAADILQIAWKFNLLHAELICYHKPKGVLVYSYNPYINKAPISWQLEESHRNENENPWILLKQRASVVTKFEPVCYYRESRIHPQSTLNV